MLLTARFSSQQLPQMRTSSPFASSPPQVFMPNDKSTDKKSKAKPSKASQANQSAHHTSAASTVSHPATPGEALSHDAAAQKMSGSDELARAMPFNPTKAAEHGAEAGRCPVRGAATSPPHPSVTGSTLTEGMP